MRRRRSASTIWAVWRRSDAADWSFAEEAVRLGGSDPAMPLGHCIEINAHTLDAADGSKLVADWSFAPALIAQDEVRDLARSWFRALEALVRHAAQPGAGGRTPSDLPLVALSQAEIERLESLYPRIEDVLPLSPLQEGLLFHALYDAQAPDVYTVQLELDLEGALDSAGLEAAAQALIARHASLRAGFRHQELSRPVQIIVPQAAPPWRMIDLSSLDEADRAAEAARIVAQDRAARFDLAAPPLMRFALIRLAAERHRLVITNHHLLMDGWSAPVLVRELFQLYASKGDAAALPRVTPYRNYLSFLAAQDREGAVAAWREALAGLEEATHVAPQARTRAPVAPGADRTVSRRDADRGVDQASAPAGGDAQYDAAGRLGDPARPHDRPRRRGVRRDGGGPAAGGCRHREHGGAVHQHAAAAGQAAAGQAALRSSQRDAGQPVATDRAPAPRPWPRSRVWPDWASCSIP